MIRRILAFILASLLIGLYVLTLVFGLMQNPRTTDLLMASIAATIIIPVILYAYQRIYRLIHSKEDNDGTGNAK